MLSQGCIRHSSHRAGPTACRLAMKFYFKLVYQRIDFERLEISIVFRALVSPEKKNSNAPVVHALAPSKL